MFPIRKVTAENVGRLARRRELENLAFAGRLKGPGTDRERLDHIVHELYRQASAEFDCAACANCCKSISPRLDEGDIARLSEGLGMPADRVVSELLARNEEHGGWMFRRMPCPLLKDNRCTCYEHRPRDCASYPHLQKDRFVSRLSNTVANCAICPVVYTVFERLKATMDTAGEMDKKDFGSSKPY